MRRGFAARKKRAAVALSLVFLCLFSACAMQGRNASKPTWLTVGTADAGGSMYANGSELAAAITARDAGLRFNLKASTGSPGNLKALLSGEVDLALITADIAAKAREEAGAKSCVSSPRFIRVSATGWRFGRAESSRFRNSRERRLP